MNLHVNPQVADTIEIEQTLIGTMFANNDAYWRVAGFLKADHFSDPLCGMIYGTIGQLVENQRAATPITVAPYLPAPKDEKQGTVMAFLAACAASAMDAGSAHSLASVIVENWQRRAGMQRLREGIATLEMLPADATPASVFGGIIADLDDLSQVDEQKEGGIASVIDGVLEIALRYETGPTVSFPLDQLREIMGGNMEPGNLYGMLSSSGEGKTSLALQIVSHAASQGHPTVLLSYDQSPEQCANQIASQLTGIENTRIRSRNLLDKEAEDYFEALRTIKSWPLFIRKCSGTRDGAAQLSAYVRSLHARKMKHISKPPLVVLDHIRKVKPRNENAHEGRIAADANGAFKSVASELGLVWFNLMQRSSAGTRRKNPRPIDNDIFGGEAGREDYDGVFYLYRGWKYLQTQLSVADDERDSEKISARFAREKWEPDEAEVGALKTRFADPSRKFRLRFEAESTRYVSKREPDPADLEPELL